MYISVIIVGAGKTGTTLAKELARYASVAGNISKIGIFDGGKITRKDTREGFFLPEDIGEYRAATVAMVLADAYPEVRFASYGNLTYTDCVCEKMFPCYGDRHLIICDCSYGKVEGQIRRIFRDTKRECAVTYMRACKEGLQLIHAEVADKRNRLLKDSKEYLYPKSNSQKLRTAYLMLSSICNIVIENPVGSIPWEEDTLFFKQKNTLPDGSMDFKAKKAHLICIGAGGTGGNVIKETIPLLLNHKRLSLTIVDGDRVEDKNLVRQAFGKSDILQNKAQVLAEKIIRQYPDLEARIHYVDSYIDSVEDIVQLETSSYPVLIGAVDNHRARQVFVQWFNQITDGVWIDSANEFEYGEVVVSIRYGSRTLSPLRSDIFPEVFTDHSPSASEASCQVINEVAPQHQVTNLVAGMIVVRILERMFEDERICGGIDYFDAITSNRIYSKFQPLYTREVEKYAKYA